MKGKKAWCLSAKESKLEAMNSSPNWATLAVVSFEQKYGYSIEAISIDTQSCSLSGAWDFETLDEPEVENILEQRLIVTSGITNRDDFAKKYSSSGVDLKTFIIDASSAAQDGVTRFGKYLDQNEKNYSAYMAIPPLERKLLPKVVKKKLEQIYAHSWKLDFDELRPELTLRQLGKRDSIYGTPPNMKRVITTSWLVKHLVDRWRDDENERKSRDYLYPDGESAELLPKSWMLELQKLNNSK
jgi:hypothetical protein